MVEDYPDHTYLSTYKFVPHQDPDVERKIMDNHQKHMWVVDAFYAYLLENKTEKASILQAPQSSKTASPMRP